MKALVSALNSLFERIFDERNSGTMAPTQVSETVYTIHSKCLIHLIQSVNNGIGGRRNTLYLGTREK